MQRIEATSVSRREFLQKGSLGVTGAAVLMANRPVLGQSSKKLKVAIVGTGSRGSQTWGKAVLEHHGDVVEIVGLCDINRKRVEVAQQLIGTSAPTFVDFDEMVKTTRPDSVIVTTVDSTHYKYVVRALELGCDAITEKPMCTDEEQCQAIIDAQKRTGKHVTVTFNARHGNIDKKTKQLLLDNTIGDLLTVDFHEYLNTSHGADYFRRWHRLKENSGTLLCHKASHHFDQANWWINSEPKEVIGEGGLKFYGRNGRVRSTHCRVCPHKKECKFYWDIMQNDLYVKLYVDCEAADGYLRDGCVFRMNTNIYDTMSVLIKYENGVQLNYTANCYLPYEGQAISFNGTRGRIDYLAYQGGGKDYEEIKVTPTFGQTEVITDFGEVIEGGHGGADMSLKNLIFRGDSGDDALQLKAGLRAGALASLMGIAAYKSIERNGQKIRIADLASL